MLYIAMYLYACIRACVLAVLYVIVVFIVQLRIVITDIHCYRYLFLIIEYHLLHIW